VGVVTKCKQEFLKTCSRLTWNELALPTLVSKRVLPKPQPRSYETGRD
jgi:hypothetical protein